MQSLEFGRCGSCSSAEKEFLTGEELAVQGQVVCALNDWNYVKMYYVQVTHASIASSRLPSY